MKNLQKIQLSAQQIALLSDISGSKLYTKNIFLDNNKQAISGLLEQAKQNAFVYLQRNKMGQKLSLFEENNIFKAVVSLQKKLNLTSIPRRIECYDISHLSGNFVYGSMVTFLDGRPAKKWYRLFKCGNKNDDFANHKEILTRRLNNFLKDPENLGWQLPDLIIVDGGKGQLSADFSVLCDFKLQDKIFLCGLAKQEEEIFLVDDSNISSLEPRGGQGGLLLNGDVKFLVQRIRDEAHRFAITNNRKARLKSAKKSELDEIKGIGIKTKTKLLATFGSVEALVFAIEKNPELVYELVGQANLLRLKNHFWKNL